VGHTATAQRKKEKKDWKKEGKKSQYGKGDAFAFSLAPESDGKFNS